MQEVLEAEMDEALGLRRASARRSVSAITRATTGGELAAHLRRFDNPKFQSLYSS